MQDVKDKCQSTLRVAISVFTNSPIQIIHNSLLIVEAESAFTYDYSFASEVTGRGTHFLELIVIKRKFGVSSCNIWMKNPVDLFMETERLGEEIETEIFLVLVEG